MTLEINHREGVYVRRIDDIVGWGVFTRRSIPAWETIEVCYCLPEKFKESQHRRYSFLTGNDTDDAYLVLGYGMIYNHSYHPNIAWEVTDFNLNLIRFFSIRDIVEGEELCHNYGNMYWKSRPKISRTLV